jgi:CheY-like chemotaxis protein
MSVEPAQPGNPASTPVVVVRLRDDGDGIDAAMLDSVFDPFVQAHAKHDRTRGGLGIGLTLVRKLVELHQGTVSAHSDGVGAGSEFIVRLPIRELVDRLPDPLDGLPPRAETPRRILLVDDSVDASEALARLLRHLGHEVAVGHDGRGAHDLALAFRPDVVLLDIGLPGASGFDLAREMRRTPELSHALLIALTGYGSQEDRALGREAGFDHHFTKPVDLRQLRRLLGGPSTQP